MTENQEKGLMLVTNTGPLINLGKMNCLDILTKIYSQIYCTQSVKDEVQRPQNAVDFVNSYIEPRNIKNQSYIRSIQKDHRRLTLAEIETFVLFNEIESDHALFLNNRAERVFNNEYNGNVNDVVELPELDLYKVVFKTENDIDAFYLQLNQVMPEFKRLQKILRERNLIS